MIRIKRKELLTRPGPHTSEMSEFQMEWIVRRASVHGYDEKAEDLAYWLFRPPAEKLAAGRSQEPVISGRYNSRQNPGEGEYRSRAPYKFN